MTDAVVVLDFISTFAFGWVGARVAATKNLDYGGILFVAAVSALSGGTFRNIVLQIHPAWIDHPYLFIAVGLAFLITIIMASKNPVGKFGLILDSLGLGFSVVAAVDVSLRNHAPVYAAIVLGVLSGVLGGLTRDVLCQVPPVLLHRETSGTVSVLGACVYVGLYKSGYDSLIAGISGGVLIVLLRLASIKFKINLPKVG